MSTTTSIEVNQRAVAYQTSNGTGRPIVFIHGNSSSKATWQEQLGGEVGSQHQCIAIDLPGHGDSEPAADPADYSLPGYAAVVAAVMDAERATDAVVVGWSLGGHIALEAVPALREVAGVAIFGTPPLGKPPAMERAFLPNPAMETTFSVEVDEPAARRYAESFVAPDATVDLDPIVHDILRTDGAARGGLAASVSEGRFADELEIAASMTVPLAIIHGTAEQLVSGEYLAAVSLPTLWRNAVQTIDGAGHAPHLETPDAFDQLLLDFVTDV